MMPDGSDPDARLGDIGHVAARANEIAHNAEDAHILTRLLARAKRELDPDTGTNDGEHDVLHELVDLLTPNGGRQ